MKGFKWVKSEPTLPGTFQKSAKEPTQTFLPGPGASSAGAEPGGTLPEGSVVSRGARQGRRAGRQRPSGLPLPAAEPASPRGPSWGVVSGLLEGPARESSPPGSHGHPPEFGAEGGPGEARRSAGAGAASAGGEPGEASRHDTGAGRRVRGTRADALAADGRGPDVSQDRLISLLCDAYGPRLCELLMR